VQVGVKPWAPDRTKSFKDDPERMFGIESRSLKGCYEFMEVSWEYLLAWHAKFLVGGTVPLYLLQFPTPFFITHSDDVVIVLLR
jgi:hypothetical protein